MNFISNFAHTTTIFLMRQKIMRLMDAAVLAVAALMPCRAQTGFANYKMAGPYEVVARDGEHARTKGGSERDMWAAWQCALEGHHAKAREIIDAYAATLQRFEGHDGPLCLIQAYWLLRAMIIEKGDAAPAAWEAMVRRAMLPTMERFDAASPYANGNWGAIVNRCRMAAAIFMADSALYAQAKAFYLHANDNGALPHYVGPTGQCQETGRDQAHAQLGLGALCETCEMAWEQGDDLWGALDNRLMHGMEYTARYNLGYDVPFETWTDCTGLYSNWTVPGSMARGVIRTIYDLPYNHYVGRCGLEMPYTKRVLQLQQEATERGELTLNPEANRFTVKGVAEGKKLNSIVTYPAPEGAPLRHDYDVFIRPRDIKEWTRIDTYMARVNAPVEQAQGADYNLSSGTGHAVSEISYCVFDFTGDVLVRVVSKNRKFRSARIRPDYRGTIANVLNDSTVEFLLFQPENVSVELDGDIRHNLLVFTSQPPLSRLEAERQAKAEGRRFIYIPPGYRPSPIALRKGEKASTAWADKGSKQLAAMARKKGRSGDAYELLIPSNTTVYLDGGAYFTGTFAIEDAENVSIVGRGIARPADGFEGCHVHRSRNVVVDGLVLNTCPIGESRSVTLHDVRSISHPGWGDGLNVFGGSSDILFDRVFCRNSDDCTTAYATRKGFSGSVRNVRMRNSTLWADVAHPIFIGLHGAAAGPHPELRDTVENLTYENIDIICQAEPQVDYQGCMAINAGDNNLVRNILFDNIRIENINRGCLLHVKVAYNAKYCAAPGTGVDGVTFRNIRYSGQRPYTSVINGWNEERRVSNITFEGLKINGQLIFDEMPGKPRWYSTADYVPIFVGNHVENVVFKK